MRGITDYIRRFLGSPDALARVRMGRGVVGNTTYAFWAACAAIIAALLFLSSSPLYALAAIFLVGSLFVIFMLRTHAFADKHPDLAMLGDTEWLQYKELQGAKHAEIIDLAQEPVEAAGSPKLINPSSKGEK